MILHLLRMRRNVNRNVFNARKNVSATSCTHMPMHAHINMRAVYVNVHRRWVDRSSEVFKLALALDRTAP